MTKLRQEIITAVNVADYYEELELTIQHHNAEAAELWDLFYEKPMTKSQLRKLRQYFIILGTQWINWQLDGADVKASQSTISKALHEAGIYEAMNKAIIDNITSEVPENIEGLKRIML